METKLGISVVEYLIREFKVKEEDVINLVTDEESGLYCIQEWLKKTYKIIVVAIPSIDPKYNDRLWYTIGLFEWSRSHEFWMDKSSSTRYYDSSLVALGYGLLQGLEIAKFKQDGNI